MIAVDIYSIMDSETGLFSKGGFTPVLGNYGWSKKGKVWSSSGAIRSHLNLFVHQKWLGSGKGYEYTLNIPEHWVVIRTFANPETGVLQQEEINAKEFYLQSKDTVYAKALRKKEK